MRVAGGTALVAATGGHYTLSAAHTTTTATTLAFSVDLVAPDGATRTLTTATSFPVLRATAVPAVPSILAGQKCQVTVPAATELVTSAASLVDANVSVLKLIDSGLVCTATVAAVHTKAPCVPFGAVTRAYT